MPLRDSASAVERPPIPPPTTRTGDLSLVVLTDYSFEIERGIETFTIVRLLASRAPDSLQCSIRGDRRTTPTAAFGYSVCRTET